MAVNVNDALAVGNVKFWKKQLNSLYPALQLMAVERLADWGELNADELLNIFRTNPNYIVRLGCMLELANYGGEQFIRCLDLAVDDSYELISRMAITRVGKNGDPRLIPAVIRVAIENNTGERLPLFNGAVTLFERDFFWRSLTAIQDGDFYLTKKNQRKMKDQSL